VNADTTSFSYVAEASGVDSHASYSKQLARNEENAILNQRRELN
jgi:hypothetical protein